MFDIMQHVCTAEARCPSVSLAERCTVGWPPEEGLVCRRKITAQRLKEDARPPSTLIYPQEYKGTSTTASIGAPRPVPVNQPVVKGI